MILRDLRLWCASDLRVSAAGILDDRFRATPMSLKGRRPPSAPMQRAEAHRLAPPPVGGVRSRSSPTRRVRSGKFNMNTRSMIWGLVTGMMLLGGAVARADTDEQAVIAAEHQTDKAFLTMNADLMAPLLADNFVSTD